MKKQLLFIFISILLLQTVSADQEEFALKKRATSVYQEILSPFCPGRSLNDCPSSKAHELKEEILVQLKSGASDQDVLTGVFAKIGDQYRAIPKSEGFGKMVWIAPLGFLTIGFLVAVAVVSKRRSCLLRTTTAAPCVPTPEAPPSISREMQEEVARELANWDDRH
jgi:cytochrome c-type biogenesis protein CcmH/NrfF